LNKSRALALLFLFYGIASFAQETDCGTEDRKAEKYYEKGTDRKNSKGERIEYLIKALERDPDYPEANFAMAYIRIRDNVRRGKPFDKAKPKLIKAVEGCPTVHAAAFFYLAELEMLDGNYAEASRRYKQFLDFNEEGDDKYDMHHDEQLVKAREQYQLARFFESEYNNPKPFDPKVVKPVSTNESDEYLPLISPDNELMLFTRRDKLKQNPRGTAVQSARVNYIERFSSAKLKNNKLLDKGSPLPPPFNEEKEQNYGGAALTINNKEIFITICTPGRNYVNCDIYSSKKVYGVNPRTKEKEWYWDELKPLDETVNTPKGWEAQPTLSRDGKTLIFASLREGSKGIDLYQSKRQPDGSWGQAMNLGLPLNTEANEKTPFFHADSRTLYFSSTGHLNFGGYDVFYSKLNDDGSWSEPINLGYPINTESDEHGYVVSTDGKRVYYAAKEFEGQVQEKVNIYSFKLYEEARPEKVVVMKGSVRNKNGKVPEDAEVNVRNSVTEEVEKFEVDSIDGNYTAIVTMEEDADYVFNIEGKDVAFNNYTISGDIDTSYMDVDMEVDEVSLDKPYRIDNITFKTNSASLSGNSKSTLDAFAHYLDQNPTMKVSIEGHTDNVGDPESNLTLSTERAFTVMEYLQSQGISSDRLSFKGWGSKKPLASNSTEKGRAKNRRTEFVIKSK
jgi:outer membrane protein OmpA-like peptidoglycan-associated protein/tetratricopeptide (TPR) repeat protein